MKFAKLFASSVVLAVLTLWAIPAHAQEASITVDPAAVDAPGPADFLVTGRGFPAGETVFVLACPGAEGDPEAVTSDTATTMCEIGGMQQPVASPDGGFEVILSGDVPEVGLVIVATTQGSGVAASHVVTAGGEAPAPEPTPEPTAAPTEEATPEATTTELARTGGESGLMAIVGVSVVIGGMLLLGMSRRISRI